MLLLFIKSEKKYKLRLYSVFIYFLQYAINCRNVLILINKRLLNLIRLKIAGLPQVLDTQNIDFRKKPDFELVFVQIDLI